MLWKVILQHVKATFPLIAGFSTFMNSAYSQQHVIADKDNTRPEITAQVATPAKITYFSAIQRNGYNDIQWTALSEQDTRRYIVEYSIDGINYQTAGETLVVNGICDLKHYTRDTSLFSNNSLIVGGEAGFFLPFLIVYPNFFKSVHKVPL